MIRLTTVGTGTAAPSPRRVQSGHLIESGPIRLLLDCGSGVVFRMAALGARWQEITHVALTHFHADHTTDLANLLYAWRYGELPSRSAPVEVIGPPGTVALVSRLAAAFGEGLLSPGYPLSIRELAPGATADLGAGNAAGGVTIEARKVPHTAESVAYSVVAGGRRVVYTGDTGFDPPLGEWASGTDVLLAECSLPDSLAIPTHLTPQQCGELARIASPALLVLTHFYPPVEQTDIQSVVGERFGGRVVLATDGWSLELEDA